MNNEISLLTEGWQEYIELENTEISEYWSAIADMLRHSDCMSLQFQTALVDEVHRIDKNLKENYEIVEREEVIPSVRTRRVRLVWKG